MAIRSPVSGRSVALNINSSLQLKAEGGHHFASASALFLRFALCGGAGGIVDCGDGPLTKRNRAVLSNAVPVQRGEFRHCYVVAEIVRPAVSCDDCRIQ